MAVENGTRTCDHCRLVLDTLERCKPLTPNVAQWGAKPFWGNGTTILAHQLDHPVLVPGDCGCRCHVPWRILTGNKL
jgi:hypothetical protein